MHNLDYYDKQTGRPVCDQCAAKYAPEMVKIKEAAENYAERDREMVVADMRLKIIEAINEPVGKRIIRVMDEICNIEADVPF